MLYDTFDCYIAVTHTSWANKCTYVFAELTMAGFLKLLKLRFLTIQAIHHTLQIKCILAVTHAHTQSDTRSEYRIWADRKLTQGQSWIMGAVLRKVLADQLSSQSRFIALC